MRVGTILRINHEAYGRFAMVTQSNRHVTTMISESSMELPYETVDAEQFPVIGRIVVGQAYNYFSYIGGPKRRRCYIEAPDGTKRACPNPIVADEDGCEITSTPVIRLLAFYEWAEGAA